MKRILVAAIIAAVVLAPAAFAETGDEAVPVEDTAEAVPALEGIGSSAASGSAGPFTIDLFTGGYYYLIPLTGDPIIDPLIILLSLRAGGTVDFEYNFGAGFGAGAETGVLYFPSGDDFTLQIFDIPIRAKASFEAGLFKAELFAGVLYSIYATTTDVAVSQSAEGGLRFGIWRIFLEGSYGFILGAPIADGLFRFGLGAYLPLAR